jgi:hypothetical protein
LFRLKTRVVWYVNGKNTGLYRSFDDYRNSWKSTSVWSKIKTDFRLSRDLNNRVVSNNNNGAENLMNNIRETRKQRGLDKLMRTNKTNLNR